MSIQHNDELRRHREALEGALRNVQWLLLMIGGLVVWLVLRPDPTPTQVHNVFVSPARTAASLAISRTHRPFWIFDLPAPDVASPVLPPLQRPRTDAPDLYAEKRCWVAQHSYLDEYLSIPRFPNEIRIAQDELKDERALLMNLVANTVGDTVRSAGRRVGGDQLELVLRAVSLLELLPEGQRDSDALETLQKILQRINDGLFGIEARFGLERIYLMAPQLKPRSCPQAEEVRDTLIQIGRKLIEALRSETEKAYDEAETLYQAAYADAVEVRARELMVRSAMGSVRCSALRSRKDAWCDYARAKAFVTIQLARTPFLADMMMPLPDLVFISYRSETREFVERLDESIAAELPQLKPWVDYGAIDQLAENFRPAMQLGLDRCRHAILVFSKEYFTSPWCTYEWSTLLARGEGNVQLHWLSVADPPAGVEQPHGAVAGVEQMAERATGSSAQQRFITSQLQQIRKIKPLYEHAVPLSDHAAIVPMIIDRLRQEIPRRGISAQ